jgi:quinol monooxygenase YgiN
MWAQLITMRLQPGKEAALGVLSEQLKATEQPDSGFLRQMAMQDQNDPNRFFVLALFESEEKARARENDPRREEGLKAVRATMMESIDGTPEFTDLNVLFETTL